MKCLIHDHIWKVNAIDLLKGGGSPKCGYIKSAKKRVLKVEEFIERARASHGDKYDYSLVHQFKRQKEYVKIICPIHGEFEQSAQSHYLGSECTKCWQDRRSSVLSDSWEETLIDFREEHGYTYEYDESTFVNVSTPMTLFCKKHGAFNQKPVSHKNGRGCSKCGRDRIKASLLTSWNDVLRSFKKIHGNRFTYNSKSYKDLDTSMEMFCSLHGKFLQTPKNHRNGSKCNECAIIESSQKRILPWSDVLKSFKSVHRDEYDYVESTYISTDENMEIICKKHGSFFQDPAGHKNGRGCPICKSSRGEKAIGHYLMDRDIQFIHQKKYRDLGKKRFDIYVIELNLIIEYHGRQHFMPIDFFGGEEAFQMGKKNDNIKQQYCIDNHINYEVIRYDEDVETRMDAIIKKY